MRKKTELTIAELELLIAELRRDLRELDITASLIFSATGYYQDEISRYQDKLEKMQKSKKNRKSDA